MKAEGVVAVRTAAVMEEMVSVLGRDVLMRYQPARGEGAAPRQSHIVDIVSRTLFIDALEDIEAINNIKAIIKSFGDGNGKVPWRRVHEAINAASGLHLTEDDVAIARRRLGNNTVATTQIAEALGTVAPYTSGPTRRGPYRSSPSADAVALVETFEEAQRNAVPLRTN